MRLLILIHSLLVFVAFSSAAVLPLLPGDNVQRTADPARLSLWTTLITYTPHLSRRSAPFTALQETFNSFRPFLSPLRTLTKEGLGALAREKRMHRFYSEHANEYVPLGEVPDNIVYDVNRPWSMERQKDDSRLVFGDAAEQEDKGMMFGELEGKVWRKEGESLSVPHPDEPYVDAPDQSGPSCWNLFGSCWSGATNALGSGFRSLADWIAPVETTNA